MLYRLNFYIFNIHTNKMGFENIQKYKYINKVVLVLQSSLRTKCSFRFD